VNALPEISQMAILIAVIGRCILGASQRGCDFILTMISLLLFKAFGCDESVRKPQDHLISHIPPTIDQALPMFGLEGRTTTYAVCPTCHCTYSPSYPPGGTEGTYPRFCTNLESPDSAPCSTALLDGDGQPLRKFVYHSFHDYLAGLLSQPGLEEQMNAACDDVLDNLDSKPWSVSDVWEADFFHSFKGPVPDTLFVDRKGEGRYAFSLNFDSFNINGNNKHGASASSSVIAMVCLNLPREIRYKPEYVYLAGIIPGPLQPKGTQLNHFLKPLLDDLVLSWKTGVFYTRTALHPGGVLTRSIVACAVCDFVGARHLAQYARHGSHILCHIC
jgi:hypothetical protein